MIISRVKVSRVITTISIDQKVNAKSPKVI